MTTGKTITLTRWTFVGKVMALIFDILSRFFITFLPSSKHLLISWLSNEIKSNHLPSKGCFFLCNNGDTSDISETTLLDLTKSVKCNSLWQYTLVILVSSNFEHYFTSVWDECNCAVVWAFFGIAFLWDWNENWPFPVLTSINNKGILSEESWKNSHLRIITPQNKSV